MAIATNNHTPTQTNGPGNCDAGFAINKASSVWRGPAKNTPWAAVVPLEYWPVKGDLVVPLANAKKDTKEK